MRAVTQEARQPAPLGRRQVGQELLDLAVAAAEQLGLVAVHLLGEDRGDPRRDTARIAARARVVAPERPQDLEPARPERRGLDPEVLDPGHSTISSPSTATR